VVDARATAVAELASGEPNAVIFGCHLLGDLGPAAGDIVPLVWEYLRHPDELVRGNAGFALFKCCVDKRALAEAAEILEPTPTPGDGLGITTCRYAAHKLRQAAQAEPAAADVTLDVPDPGA
jgi:hypothetical protein